MKIQGRTAWITGASAGIGEALSRKLFHLGATIILSARNVSRLNELKNELDAIVKGRCFVVPCDVTRPDEIKQAALKLKELVPRLDILVNNAGVSQRSYALDTTIDIDRALMEVNFFGAIGITKAILPWMIVNGGGHIVVISSIAGKFGFRMRTAYSASKHALNGYFESLRAELHDKNVKITIICPGRIKTDISVNALTGDGKRYGKMDKGQANGVTLEKSVCIIARAIKKNSKEKFIGMPERFLLLIKRICPPLFYRIVNRASPT
jgi:dehydrogenase/reductase SDR family protein 7B